MKPIKLTTGRFAGKTFYMASQERVARLSEHVQRVLDALGHSEALVTDMSSVGDFNLEPDERALANAALGLALSDDMLIADVAEILAGGQ